MKIDILTLFPEMFTGIINSSIIARAINNGSVEINVHDFRSFSTKNNKMSIVFMVFKIELFWETREKLQKKFTKR